MINTEIRDKNEDGSLPTAGGSKRRRAGLTWMGTSCDADAQQVQLVCFPKYLQWYFTDDECVREHAISVESSAFSSVLARLSQFRGMFVSGFIEGKNKQRRRAIRLRGCQP
jgi:hypothetical protein